MLLYDDVVAAIKTYGLPYFCHYLHAWFSDNVLMDKFLSFFQQTEA